MPSYLCVAVCLSVLLMPLAAFAADDGGLFAATGVSRNADVLAAAEEATKAMMATFQSAGRKPSAIIFLERVADPNKFKGRGQAIGDKVKELSGGAATFGHGGVGVYGPAMTADLKDKDSSFLVLGLSGANLDVKGYAVGGAIQYSYASETPKPADPAKVEAWQKSIDREKELRQVCRDKAAALGKTIPALAKPGLILVLGSLHNNWHATFMEGLRQTVSEQTAMVGGVGVWTDYVYSDGKPVKDPEGKDSLIGQIAIVIQGDIQVSLAGQACAKKGSADVEAAIDAVVAKGLAGLGGKKPAAVLAFSCVTLLRDSKINDPGVIYARLAKGLGGSTPVLGCFCGGELGSDNGGAFSVGGDRLMMAAIAGK